ncbi:hypothetical protein BHE74_00036364 [Ensete ventricosum]|nr:hypothetical protein BHE74_00036364 [Ensete ventricosum]
MCGTFVSKGFRSFFDAPSNRLLTEPLRDLCRIDILRSPDMGIKTSAYHLAEELVAFLTKERRPDYGV